ncbi:nucleotidyltransferase family protein [Sphingobium lactosutens]|uniref:Polymerase nucleotidyl transferase domain-containing protein n=1 Tax=Sphingobium lactosutens DS20 TaxID=1331060 RepID=T0H2N2_9SPHN|nr:nucleotidyltransferase domain-containing protein [Sphingobium lactosutens]EQB10636.1 hypothetical protein RLDS_27015 [Sphingobium lactosutens DS20]
MTRDEAIARIRPHEAELRAAGITSLALFGSIARGEGREGSDIDLMCEIDRASRMDLIQFAGLQRRLEEYVERPVDLVERHSMRPRIRVRAEADKVLIF